MSQPAPESVFFKFAPYGLPSTALFLYHWYASLARAHCQFRTNIDIQNGGAWRLNTGTEKMRDFHAKTASNYWKLAAPALEERPAAYYARLKDIGDAFIDCTETQMEKLAWHQPCLLVGLDRLEAEYTKKTTL